MKKLCFILAAAFMLSAFQPCQALTNYTYASSNNTNGYIVKLKEKPSDAVSLMGSGSLTEINKKAGLYRAATLSDIEKLGDDVLYCEPDYKAELFELPNDPYASKQWSIDYLGVSSAWNAGYTGEGVKIAVIDSGINASHEDFAGSSIATGYNVINNSNDVTDEMGHGTFVSGILTATMNNSVGIAGLCPNAAIIPIKCFGRSKETNLSYIIESIYKAVDDFDCDVINMSLGSEQSTKSLYDAVAYAAGKGVIVISAVGNGGNATLNYPAAYDCVIGVGAVKEDGSVASFSEKNASVFVVAPGTNIESLYYKTSDTYDVGNGTSFSTPFVTAAAVIVKQYAPDSTVNDLGELLKISSIDAGEAGYDTSYGYGILNYPQFIEAMQAYGFINIEETFPDVAGHWALSSIENCYKNNLFTGVTQSSFEPETVMNRAMFVTVLSRMSGQTISGYTNSFTDVTDSTWYTQPCAWGAENGIVTGMGDGTFNPVGAVTREQMAVFLYRYAILFGLTDGRSNGEAVLFTFADKNQVSPWAADAMAWAVENGLITGRSETNLSPRDSAKRCEVATIITRFANVFGVLKY